MTHYRATIRFGPEPKRYRVQDLEAETLLEALAQLVEAFPADAARTADLLEIRRQTGPDERVYGPE